MLHQILINKMTGNKIRENQTKVLRNGFRNRLSRLKNAIS